MIKYLGSKRQLIAHIVNGIENNFPKAKSVLDLFSGTSRVGIALKNKGFQVLANDHNLFAYYLARCYVETDQEDIPKDFIKTIDILNNLPPDPGFITKNYCESAKFFHPNNGAKIDAIRDHIDTLKLPDQLKVILMVSLMEAADRVDSTCGIQMSYLKNWAPRALKPLLLRMPNILPKVSTGPCKAYFLDAQIAAKELETDVTYLDPPYNQHSYRGNYHIWETLVRWDKPALYGVAKKRIDCQTFKSDFNTKRKFFNAFENIISILRSPNIIISFNDEGFIDKNSMEKLLKKFGSTKTKQIDYKRYVGAQIGIFNPKGEKVGQVKNLRNNEFIYILKKHKN